MLNFLNEKSKILNALFYLIISIVLILGVYIRLRYYFFQPPLWVDEIMLASSFTDRALFDIFTPLEAYQKAPPLFSFSVLIIRKIFGVSELTLRFVSFLCGIFSIIIFYLFLKENVKNKVGIITGLCMFTFCVPLVYFSGEFKPYGCDVFFLHFIVLVVSILIYIRFL